MAEKKVTMDLTEYSRKYKLSVSTLRRRIKNGELEYSLRDGKYYLYDTPPATPVVVPPLPAVGLPVLSIDQETRVVAPPPKVSHSRESVEVEVPRAQAAPEPDPQLAIYREELNKSNDLVKRLSQDGQTLLAELKSTYSMVLQEKEEQIIMLREEISDLRTLVKALEEMNSTLKKQVEKSDPALWNEFIATDLEV